MATKHSVTAAATPDDIPTADSTDKVSAAEPKPKTSRRRATQTKSRNKTAPAKAPKSGLNELVGDLVEKADAAAQGTVQVAVRVSPRTKQRLRTSMIRAGLVQERFIAMLIERGLDELDEILAERDAAEK